MRTPSTVLFAAADALLTKFHIRPHTGRQGTGALEVRGRQNQEPTELVLVKVSNGVDEISVEGHDSSGNLERGKQASGRPAVCQSPAERWGQSVRMLTTHQVPRSRRHPFSNVIQPDSAIGVVIRHNRGGRRSTSCTRSNHAGQLRRLERRYQGFRLTRRFARKTILSFTDRRRDRKTDHKPMIH